MMILTTLALLAAQAAPAPACELEGVPAVDLVALRVAILDKAMNGTPKPASAEATMRTIETKAAACQAGSDPAVDRAAVAVAAARLAADSVAEKLAADGVDMAAVAAAVAQTDRPILEALVARQMDAVGVDELRQRIMTAAGGEPGDETRRLLAFYAVNAARVAVGVPAPVVAPKPVVTAKPKTPVER